ncbi:MAG: HupE/UreJ family protein, partial [Bacteroidota bacterium]
EASIVKPLFAFNVGIEAGQLMIVIVLLGIGYLIMNVLKVKQQSWTIFISGAAAGIALTLMIPFLTGAG